MILPVSILHGRCAADFPQAGKIHFACVCFSRTFFLKACASDAYRAFAYQYRYPSPSRWPDPHLRVRSRSSRHFGQAVADPRTYATNALALPFTKSIYASRGCGTGQTGGTQQCKRHLHSQRSLRFSPLPHAVTTTLSAGCPARLSVRSVRNLQAETRSLGPHLAARPGYSATISHRNSAGNQHQSPNYRRSSGLCAPATVVVLASRRTTKEGPCLRKS